MRYAKQSEIDNNIMAVKKKTDGSVTTVIPELFNNINDSKTEKFKENGVAKDAIFVYWER